MQSRAANLFFNNWIALKAGGDSPSSAHFLDHPNVKLQPKTFILELVEDEQTKFRLMATDLVKYWGTDLTGRNLEDVFSREIARRYVKDIRDCAAHSCGLSEIGLYGDFRNRELELEFVYLPLQAVPEKPQRIVGFIELISVTENKAKRTGLLSISKRQWVDLGSGIPRHSPQIFSAI
jgi:hypothetical protein